MSEHVQELAFSVDVASFDRVHALLDDLDRLDGAPIPLRRLVMRLAERPGFVRVRTGATDPDAVGIAVSPSLALLALAWLGRMRGGGKAGRASPETDGG